MKKETIYFLFMAFCLFYIVPSHAQTDTAKGLIRVNDTIAMVKKKGIGLEVKPVRIDFSLTPGRSAVQPIYITNKFPEKMVFKARFSDWVRDTVGGHQYLEPGTIPRSCAQWMSFENNSVEIEPGKTKEILVKMQLPPDDSTVETMHWALVFIESVKENRILKPTDSSRTTMNTIFRVGIHILQTPPNLQSEKQIEMVSFQSMPEQKGRYRIACKNTGETQLECKTYLELSSLDNGQKTTVGPVMFPIFPDQDRFIDFDLPQDLAKGKYSILAVIDANEDEVPLQASEAVIEVN